MHLPIVITFYKHTSELLSATPATRPQWTNISHIESIFMDVGREGDPLVTPDDDEWINNHPALQERVRLQALTLNICTKPCSFNGA